jgi:ABC-type phosphate/phosphonate transport system substrate-binding protein
MTVLLGAVAYDPKVVTIWNGFRVWLREHDLDLDYVLYAHYERQAEDLVAGRIDVAWNSPLAWVRARRLAAASGLSTRPVVMRDTDRDLTTAVVVRAGSDAAGLADLRGRQVGVGAVDSPQATLLPLRLLRSAGLAPGQDVTVIRHDTGVGLHGDHVGGEREAAVALREGRVDAACMTDASLLLFGREGTLAAGTTRVLATTPPFDHCMLTAAPGADRAGVERLAELLLSMSYADESARPLMDLEGLTRWVPPRTTRYADLERAVDEAEFYDESGEVIAAGYRP